MRQIVHETSTQRQHVRIRAPIRVIVGSQEYVAEDWSVAGLAISGASSIPAMGQLEPLQLRFTFEGFSFELDLTGEVRFVDPVAKKVGFRFHDMTPAELSVLQVFVGAYLSGEIVTADDVLAVTQRNNFVTARNAANQTPVTWTQRAITLFQRLFLLAIPACIALALVGIIAFSGFSRAFIVGADGVLTSPEAQMIRAPKAGTVLALNSKPGVRTAPGQVVATLEGADGQAELIKTNCDCVLGQFFTTPGAFVPKGTAIASTAPFKGRLSAEFIVPLAEAHRIQVGDSTSVTFYRGQPPAGGRVEAIYVPTFTETNATQVIMKGATEMTAIIRVRFADRLPATYVGQPASVKINTFRYFS